MQQADKYLREFSELEVRHFESRFVVYADLIVFVQDAWSVCAELISAAPHPAVSEFMASILVQKVQPLSLACTLGMRWLQAFAEASCCRFGGTGGSWTTPSAAICLRFWCRQLRASSRTRRCARGCACVLLRARSSRRKTSKPRCNSVLAWAGESLTGKRDLHLCPSLFDLRLDCRAGLELLALLPDQVQVADVVMQARKGLEEALRASLPQVLAVILTALAAVIVRATC